MGLMLVSAKQMPATHGVSHALEDITVRRDGIRKMLQPLEQKEKGADLAAMSCILLPLFKGAGKGGMTGPLAIVLLPP